MVRRRCEIYKPDQIEYELDIADGRMLRLHADCVAVWHAARAEQMIQPQAGAQATPEDRLAIITELIMEQPLCAVCICEKTGIDAAKLLGYFARIERAFVNNERLDRCQACGESTMVFSLMRS